MRILLFLVAFCLVFHPSVGANTCSNTLCGANDLCCDEPTGAKCYNPETNTCELNEKGEKLLCGYIGGNWYPAKACGGRCYDEYEFSCCNGELYSRFNTKQNPCLNAPGTFQPGCERCAASLSCCNDINNGAQCYAPGSFLCLNNSVLCAIQDGTPNLVCGRSCYSSNTHTCCNGVIYSKQDRTHPCAPQAGNTTLSANWDSGVSFISNGFSSPGGTACGWTIQSDNYPTYQLHNCTQWQGAGGFHFDETSYLVSFSLPQNAVAYSHYELDVFVDNARGKDQTAALAVMDNDIPSNLKITNSTLYTFPCNTHKLYALPLYHITLKIEAGFSGYKTIDITSLATWSFSSNPSTNIQLLISSFSACSCAYGNCCYEGNCASGACSCTDPQYRFSLAGVGSNNHPKLILTA